MIKQIRSFLRILQAEKGLQKTTLEAYQQDLTHFHSWLEEQNLDSASLTEKEVVAFFRFLRNKGYASSTVSRIFITLRLFFRFEEQEQGIPRTHLFSSMEMGKSEQILPDVLTLEEVKRLVEQPDQGTVSGARDRAILELLYSSGLRVSELCQLSLYDLDEAFVRVMGKGGKERLVPVGKTALESIDHYLSFCEGRTESNPPLFITERGKRIDRVTIWRMVKQIAKKAGIQKTLSPHTLRHSFATHLLDQGADLRIIQEMLGHADIRTTDRYTHVKKSQIQQAFSTSHRRYQGD